MLCCDGAGEVRPLRHDPAVDGARHVLQEDLLLLRLHVGALHLNTEGGLSVVTKTTLRVTDLPDPGDGVVHAQVLDDGGQHHARPARTNQR